MTTTQGYITITATDNSPALTIYPVPSQPEYYVKVKTAERSEQLQHAALTKGYKWADGTKEIIFTEKPYLILRGNNTIYYSDNRPANMLQYKYKDIMKEFDVEPKQIMSKEAKQKWQNKEIEFSRQQVEQKLNNLADDITKETERSEQLARLFEL